MSSPVAKLSTSASSSVTPTGAVKEDFLWSPKMILPFSLLLHNIFSKSQITSRVLCFLSEFFFTEIHRLELETRDPPLARRTCESLGARPLTSVLNKYPGLLSFT